MYLCSRVNAYGGWGASEAAVTTRTRCGRVNFRECGELLYDKMISSKTE